MLQLTMLIVQRAVRFGYQLHGYYTNISLPLVDFSKKKLYGDVKPVAASDSFAALMQPISKKHFLGTL